MKNKAIVLISILIMLLNISANTAYSSNPDAEFIRVGLTTPLKSKDQVNLSSDGFSIGIWDKGFEEIFSLDDKSIVIMLDDNYSFENRRFILTDSSESAQIGSFHIELGNSYNTYEETMEAINKLNINAFPRYDGEYKIWIGQYSTEDIANSQLHSIEELSDTKGTVVNGNTDSLLIYDTDNNVILAFSNKKDIYLRAKGDNDLPSKLKVEDAFYRDYITFNRYGKELIVINYITMDHYLYGVVPREMSPSWPLESLKAQAIAARNFALTGLKRHESLNYDLCDTTHCQVYGGYNLENINSNRAVDETSNITIKYEGKLITAYYHSNSGGHTEDSENIWTYEVPYLRGVEDSFSIGSPNSTWQYAVDKEEIRQKLIANNIDLGDILSIEPLSFSKNGRVLELIIKGSKGNKILEKEKSRQIFGTNVLRSTWFKVASDADVYILSANSEGPQKTTLADAKILTSQGETSTNRSTSNRVKISNGQYENEVSIVPSTYIFDGRGWGHGLGMSQWGARKMAESGYNFEEILEYYYTGAKVE